MPLDTFEPFRLVMLEPSPDRLVAVRPPAASTLPSQSTVSALERAVPVLPLPMMTAYVSFASLTLYLPSAVCASDAAMVPQPAAWLSLPLATVRSPSAWLAEPLAVVA